MLFSLCSYFGQVNWTILLKAGSSITPVASNVRLGKHFANPGFFSGEQGQIFSHSSLSGSPGIKVSITSSSSNWHVFWQILGSTFSFLQHSPRFGASANICLNFSVGLILVRSGCAMLLYFNPAGISNHDPVSSLQRIMQMSQLRKHRKNIFFRRFRITIFCIKLDENWN